MWLFPKNYPTDEYIQKCRLWKEQIDEIYTDETVHQLTDLLSLFILDRQRNMNMKEVQAMFDFDISNTLVGQELIQVGEKKGEKIGQKKATKKLVAMQLAEKFNINARRVMPKLEPLRINDMMELGKDLLSMDSYEDVYQWIDERKRLIKVKR